MSNLFQIHGPAVRKLLKWNQGDDEEKWAEKAIDSLAKKLKKNKEGQGTLEDLQQAIANPGRPSKCVTIAKSLDGRLQVSHRKGLPHVIYCRVYRWRDLQSHHELRPVPECRFPYDNKQHCTQICVNPYHYQRIEQRIEQQIHPSIMPSHYSQMDHIDHMDHLALFHQSSHSPLNNTGRLFSPSYNPAGNSPSVCSEDDDEAMQIEFVRCQPDPEYWITVFYYELNSRVGEQFKMSVPQVIVDGFTDPSNSLHRICLGQLSNVNRNSVIENTRKHIGQGVQLQLLDGDVILTNLSQSPIFVQSRNWNYIDNREPNAVVRIAASPRTSMQTYPRPNKIFSEKAFNELLRASQSSGYAYVYDMTKMCSIRMSFVKGWGADYHRQEITATPCWIEIHLHRPLAHVDHVLSTMEPSPNQITSVS